MESEVEFLKKESEVEFLKKYVDIEKMRFKNQLEVDFRNNVGDSSVMIPPMLIQPVIENSIKHGIRNRKGGGRIDLYDNDKPRGTKVIINVLFRQKE